MKFGNTETGLLTHLVENPDLMKGAAMGTAVRLLILRPKGIVQAALSAATGITCGMAFGAELAAQLGWGVSTCGAVLALAGDALAKRLLDWVRRGKLPVIGAKEEAK